MDIQELKNKIITAIEKIDDFLLLLEVLRILKSEEMDSRLLKEPVVKYGVDGSSSLSKNGVPESFYNILDQERQELIDHPELAVKWNEARKIIFAK